MKTSIELAYKIHQEALADIVPYDPEIFAKLYGGMDQLKLIIEAKMWSYVNSIIIVLGFTVVEEILSCNEDSIGFHYVNWRDKNIGKNMTGNLANLIDDSNFFQKIGECYLYIISPLFQKAKQIKNLKK